MREVASTDVCFSAASASRISVCFLWCCCRWCGRFDGASQLSCFEQIKLRSLLRNFPSHTPRRNNCQCQVLLFLNTAHLSRSMVDGLTSSSPPRVSDPDLQSRSLLHLRRGLSFLSSPSPNRLIVRLRLGSTHTLAAQKMLTIAAAEG